MQLLIGESLIYNMVANIYITVAKIYDLLNKLATDYNANFNISGIATIIYVLAGVFILFRATIGLINMLINPDLIGDNRAGASSLFTRIITALILLVVCVPNGIIFGPSGFFSRLERAIIKETIPRITEAINIESATDTEDSSAFVVNPNKANALIANNILYDNVYADNSLTCYYYRVQVTENHSAPNASNDVKIYDFYKLTFSTTQTNGSKELKGLDVKNGSVYYKFSNEPVNDGKYGADFKYVVPSKNLIISAEDAVRYGFAVKEGVFRLSDSNANIPDNCPDYITDSENSNNMSIGKHINVNNDSVLNGGEKDINKMIENMNLKYEDDYVSAPTDNPAVETRERDTSDKNIGNVSDDSLLFSRNVAKTFQECVGSTGSSSGSSQCGKNDDYNSCSCEELQDHQFKSPKANNAMAKKMGDDNGDLSLDWVMSVLVGLVLIVYLILLCVEVIIRRFKLLLLEMIAPIPIVSHVDANSKSLNTWFKMYLATYVDLFIKLISITLALSLLKNILVVAPEGKLIKFLYIVAILVFAKALPTMISKLTGLDNIGGSFKEIGGMAKAAAGFGAGAAVGSLTGFATGIAASVDAFKNPNMSTGNKLLSAGGAVGSIFKGGFMGAGSGSKGDVFGGAKSISAANGYRGSQYRSGLAPTDILAANTLGKIAMDKESRVNRAIQNKQEQVESYDRFTGFKGDMENTAMESKFMRSVMQARANGFNIGEDKVERLRNEWISAQVNGENGDDFVRRITDSSATGADGKVFGDDAMIFDSLFADDRFGFDYHGDNFIEKGKQNALKATLRDAQTELLSNSDIRNLATSSNVSQITNYNDIDKVNKEVKNAQTKLKGDIYEATADPKYRTAKAAKQTEKSNPNK